jgi:hypothetical protein
MGAPCPCEGTRALPSLYDGPACIMAQPPSRPSQLPVLVPDTNSSGGGVGGEQGFEMAVGGSVRPVMPLQLGQVQ